ncbi:MAG: IPT/TIG domain-containing protein [Thermoanaerobaculaceae bacterium]|nr:IPT/TIG domain-containing protein [Thermoanaerobaculaceae bacterium]
MRDIRDIAFANDLYVAVDSRGLVFTSPDAVRWRTVYSSSKKLLAVTWAGDKFIAVGEVILTSPDGSAWTPQESPITPGYSELRSIASNGTVAIALGYPYALRSTDGATWKIVNSITNLSRVVWAGGQFLAFDQWTSAVMTSTDGTSWETRTLGDGNRIGAVAWSGSRYLAGGGDGSYVLTSPDAVVWTRQPTTGSGSCWWFAMIWTGARYVATNSYGIYSSADGLTWKDSMDGANRGWERLPSLIWTGNQAVAGGAVGILTSPDGLRWTVRTPDQASALTAAVSNGSTMVAVGDGGRLLTSHDGLRWQGTSVSGVYELSGFSAVAWNGSRFVAAGTNSMCQGLLARSDDGFHWSSRVIQDDMMVVDLVWDGTRFVAIGSGRAWTSRDGDSWEVAYAGQENLGTFLRSNGSMLLAGWKSWGGFVYTSPDAVSWVKRPLPADNWQLFSATWNGSLFMAVGTLAGSPPEPLVATSSDGQEWTRLTTDLATGFRPTAVVWDGSRFYASSSEGASSSADGKTWDPVQRLPGVVNVLLAEGGRVYGFGDNSSIMRTACSTSSSIQVSAIAPAFGSVAGGTPVTISGVGFKADATVAIGSASAQPATVLDTTTIITTTGAGGAGLADVVVTNPGGQQATLVGAFTYTQPLALQTTALPAARTGQDYSCALAATGGEPPYVWTASSSLPSGLVLLAEGVLSGWPTKSGAFPVGVEVRDALGARSTATFSLIIEAGDALFQGVARQSGNLGSDWRSEVSLFNPTSSSQTVQLKIHAKKSSAVAAARSYSMAPGEMRSIADLYTELGATEGSGVLRVCGSATAWVRTFNSTPTGTYGQSVPPHAEDMFEFDEEALFAINAPASSASGFRSNLLLLNLEPRPTTFVLTIGGAQVTYRVEALQFDQVNGVGATVGSTAGASVLSVRADGRWAGYVSTIDPDTNDPTTVRGVRRSQAGPVLFPGVTRGSGQNLSVWRSEATLLGTGEGPEQVLLEVLAKGTGAPVGSARYTLASGEVRLVSDIIQAIGAPDGSGTLRVTGRALAWVRTFSQGTHGTFGQDCTPLVSDRAFTAQDNVLFPVQAFQNTTVNPRSNLLVQNLDSKAINVTLRIGTKVGGRRIEAGAYDQFNNLGALLGTYPGTALLVVTADGRWSGSVSTIDPLTNDPTTVQGTIRSAGQ